jgi:hypothetical protein
MTFDVIGASDVDQRSVVLAAFDFQPAAPRGLANLGTIWRRLRRGAELSEQTKELTAWDEPPSATGMAAPKVLPEDEVSITEQLVHEGTDEADRERRVAAADPDFEP